MKGIRIKTHGTISSAFSFVGGMFLAVAAASGQTVWHVDDDAALGGDGTTWSSAFKFLQDALAAASSGDQIWVAAGTYVPATCNSAPCTSSSPEREATFQLVSGVGIYGGFVGNEPSLLDRRFGCSGGESPGALCQDDSDCPGGGLCMNATILSGDLNGDDDPDGPPGPGGDCCTEHPGPGCDEATCESLVCPDGPLSNCCDEVGNWGAHCAWTAERLCCDLCGENVTICENSYHVLEGSSLDGTTVIDGLIVTGGNANLFEFGSGGGMDMRDSAATIRNCIVTNNKSAGDGGGISVRNGITTIDNSIFISNSGFRGAGLFYLGGSGIELTNCMFTTNTAFFTAVTIGGSTSSILRNCSFNATSGSFPDDDRSGIGLEIVGDATLANCVFTGNESSGMRSAGGNSTLTNCTFTGNGHSGLRVDSNLTATLRNCTFTYNSTTREGGGVFAQHCSSCTLANCSFWGNSALGGGAAVGAEFSSNVWMQNCILWDGGDETLALDDSTITITHSDIEGGWPGAGNIEEDPAYVDVDGLDDIPGTDDDNLRLLPGSPCIDAGDNTTVPTCALDLAGNYRKWDDPATSDTGNGTTPIVDMGAYEFDSGAAPDCNGNALDDECEIAEGAASDCNGNNIPDECEADSDGDGLIDGCDNCELFNPNQTDCQPNGFGDVCDLNFGTSNDCQANDIPDECELDTDGDGVPNDCDNCGLFNPDQADCQPNGVGDVCDIIGTSDDCQPNDIPDECELDTDGDGVTNDCDNCGLFNPDQADCQPNGIGDLCDIETGMSNDCQANGVPDECEPGNDCMLIPTVSEWGITAMVIVLLTVGTLIFRRRQSA